MNLLFLSPSLVCRLLKQQVSPLARLSIQSSYSMLRINHSRRYGSMQAFRLNSSRHNSRRAGQAPQLNSGQAALTLTFLIGWITIIAGVTLAFLATSFSNTSLGFQSANRALAIASAGVDDAILQLVRNKDFIGTYPIDVNGVTANVTVSQVSGQATITSVATVLAFSRTIQVVASVSGENGITVLSRELQ